MPVQLATDSGSTGKMALRLSYVFLRLSAVSGSSEVRSILSCIKFHEALWVASTP
jgi:hypothetical protein